MGTTYKGIYIPAAAEDNWDVAVNANWTRIADRDELIRKSAPESVVSSTVLQNDDHLFYAMTANHTWAFKLVVSASHADGAAALKSGFTGPASAIWSGVFYSHSANVVEFSNSVAPGNPAAAPAAGRIYVYDGIVTCGATPGNFQYQWTQAANSGTPLIVATNSYLLMKLLV
jgi:acyl dehydratase